MPNQPQQFDVCVLGLGYIGLPTASILATKGLRVLGVDIVDSVVRTINEGKIHIQEPELDVLVRAAVKSGNLQATATPAAADVFIIAVPTPFQQDGDSVVPDLSHVRAATRAIAAVVRPGNLIVLESTSPVGTTEQIRDWLLAALGPDAAADDYHFAHCPERVLPGQMIQELVTNDRIVGGLTPTAAQRAEQLYRRFCTADVFLTDARTAEFAKLTENSYRDVNIAFANELSMICEELDIDVWELIRLANRHPRVNILQPGPGVGGHCIAVDPWFIVAACPQHARLIRRAREVNTAKPDFVVDLVRRRAQRLHSPVIACLGLTFKADVDDIRESPAVEIVQKLANLQLGRLLMADPHVSEPPAALGDLVELLPHEAAIEQADIVVMLVDHKQFRTVPRRILNDRIVIDTRGVWSE